MLSQNDLQSWYARLGVPERTQLAIGHIRSSDPARHVRSGRSNVTGRYPSRKMGVTIQFESHRVELAAVYELEHDAEVLEYWDQPDSIKLDYESAHGRHLGVFHTPDYFVIRRTEAGWEECKTEEDLRRLTEQNPNRYCEESSGRWRCPPGEAYARGFGLYYRVRSSRDINWVFQRNIQFLEDYLRADSSGPATAVREAVLALVSTRPGLTLSDLFDASEKVTDRDDVYWMIALGPLHVDLAASALVEPEKVRVFPYQPPAGSSRPVPTKAEGEYKERRPGLQPWQYTGVGWQKLEDCERRGQPD